jgi:hypothetical protein
MLTVQYVSGLTHLQADINTEHYPTYEQTVPISYDTNVLIVSLSVSLDNYEGFLKWCINRVRHVLVVTETDNETESRVFNMINKLNKNTGYGTLIYMNMGSVEIGHVAFFEEKSKNSAMRVKSERYYAEGSLNVLIGGEEAEGMDCVLCGDKIVSYTSKIEVNGNKIIFGTFDVDEY